MIGAMITRVGRPRQQTCHLGHPLSPANVRLNGSGSRECCACARRRSRQWQRQHRASVPRVDDKHPPTIALVVWASQNLHAAWTYHRSHADAAAQAPDDGTPYTIINVAQPKLRPPKINWPITGTP